MVKNRALRRILTDYIRHPWLHVISISTITVALLILGGFFLCSRNFDNLAERTSPQVSGTLYLHDGQTATQIEVLRTRLLALENVKSATFKTKNTVVQDLHSFLGSAGGESLLGSELFPDVIELQVKNEAGPTAVAVLKGIITKFPEVAEVDFSEDWLNQYRKVRQTIKVFGALFLVSILVGCSFIIANFMGMRHQSRKNEIDIVRLIGANRNFVLLPFLWEGLIEGLLGSLLALIGLSVLRGLLSALITVHWSTLLGVREWLFLSPWQVMAVIAMGVAMAFGGSITVFFRFHENSR